MLASSQLAAWIRELESEGKLYRFYKSREWLELRARVLEDDHHECVICRDRGVYSRATVVHHVCEVLERPDLALSEFFFDFKSGEMKKNLLSLCFKCHNEIHKRFYGSLPKPQLNEERW